MILNLGSLAFNANIIGGGGTPAWGTEMGQGDGYRFSFEVEAVTDEWLMTIGGTCDTSEKVDEAQPWEGAARHDRRSS